MRSLCSLYKGIQVISAPCGSHTYIHTYIHTLHYIYFYLLCGVSVIASGACGRYGKGLMYAKSWDRMVVVSSSVTERVSLLSPGHI